MKPNEKSGMTTFEFLGERFDSIVQNVMVEIYRKEKKFLIGLLLI